MVPAALLALLLPVAGCATSPRDAERTPSASGSSRSAGESASRSASESASTAVGPVQPRTKAEIAYDAMTPRERVGQLFMTALLSTGPSQEAYDALVAHAGGNAFLRGPSDLGTGSVTEITRRIEDLATVHGVRPFVSADQEGGNAQALEGDGFSPMPTALTQGQESSADLQRDAHAWAGELLAAGVNLDLAPVGDVVPAGVGVANAPIGYFRRQYGDTPQTASPAVAAFVRGMQGRGVATSVKHFPGLGRATGNTDSDPAATDPTVRGDPLLAPFGTGVRAGAAFVMVSSAHYPGIDPVRRACFSPVVIRDMLRGDLGFRGLVISDSFGSASVASVRSGQRAVRFLGAGGTMVLDTNDQDLAPMTAAVLARAKRDPAFADLVETDVRLVLDTKERFHLIR